MGREEPDVGAGQVHCANPGCRCILSVPMGMLDFHCPLCKLSQALPLLLHPRGVDATKLQLPCAQCQCILIVPRDVDRFKCPKCSFKVTLDPVKLLAYRTAVARRNILFGQAPGVLDGAASGGIINPASWSGLRNDEEINEVALEVEQEKEGGIAGETFTDYRPSNLSIGPRHPDPIVETASLSAVQPPEAVYQLKIGAEMEQSGGLSCLQLETIVYASQRHMLQLADRSRAGFFLGDGAGVGKGRTIAGLVWENWQQGRKKSVWLSVASDLKFDARRDLDDVGAGCVEVHALNKLPYLKLDSNGVNVREGVLFVTYSSLIASSSDPQSRPRTRLLQLVQWCGPDFEGLLVFDECHKAKNLIPEAGGQPTRTGGAVLDLQAKMANARVVYCSATGASEPRNMGYMSRLGLWGTGADFPDFEAFLGALEKRSVGILELVAMDMKARGMYVCRTLSFKSAEFGIDEVVLKPGMKKMYSVATQFWNELRAELMVALEAIQDRGLNQNQLWRLYWANHQRFFRQLCISAKVPAAVRLANVALSEGKCVVIGLQSTGEARTEEAVKKYGIKLDGFLSGPRELLLQLMEEHYPLPPDPDASSKDKVSKVDSKKRPHSSNSAPSGKGKMNKTVVVEKNEDVDARDEAESDEDLTEVDDESKVCSSCGREDVAIPLRDCSRCPRMLHPVCLSPTSPEDPKRGWVCSVCTKQKNEIRQELRLLTADQRQRFKAAKKRQARIVEVIRALDLPNNPLDDIIDQLGGHDRVAEMTGRRARLVRARNGEGVIYEARNTKDATFEMINMHEKQQFMDGKKLVAVISEAASAGVSLQADRRAINQKRRVHITLELPWSADRAIQQFGRTHRSNQASAPQYRLLFTNLGGERRFASIVAKRLEILGALTQGDRRAGAGQSLSAFNYDSVFGKTALTAMYKSIMGQIESPVPPFGRDTEDVEKYQGFCASARYALLCVGIIREAFVAPPSSGSDKDGLPKGLRDVGRFLNRLLGLEPEFQNRLFDFFVHIFDLVIQGARKEGQFDPGIADIKANSIELQETPKPVYKDPMSGALTTLFILKIDRGFTWEKAKQFLEQSARDEDKDNGFYLSKRANHGRMHSLAAIEKFGSNPRMFRIFRPASGEAAREMSSTELLGKYNKVPSMTQANKGWLYDYNLSADQCMHGRNCKGGSSCTVGRRLQQMNILGGLILPIWGTVEKALSKEVQPSHRRLRVVRLETTNDSQRIVGLHIPNPAVATILSCLNRSNT